MKAFKELVNEARFNYSGASTAYKNDSSDRRCRFLEYNKVILRYDQRELVSLGLGIADGSFAQEYIVNWIKEHKV